MKPLRIRRLIEHWRQGKNYERTGKTTNKCPDFLLTSCSSNGGNDIIAARQKQQKLYGSTSEAASIETKNREE